MKSPASIYQTEDLRQVAFQQSIELLSREAGLAAVAPPLRGATRSAPAVNEVSEGAVQKIERKVGLPQALIGEVYAEDGQGGADIVVGVGKLDSSTAAALEQCLAALVLRACLRISEPPPSGGGRSWLSFLTVVMPIICSKVPQS